jgi:hypothetical protein
MSSRYISDEALSIMCIDGIKSHLKAELKERIISEIDSIVNSAFKKFEAKAYEITNIVSDFDRKIRLELVFINKEKTNE